MLAIATALPSPPTLSGANFDGANVIRPIIPNGSPSKRTFAAETPISPTVMQEFPCPAYVTQERWPTSQPKRRSQSRERRRRDAAGPPAVPRIPKSSTAPPAPPATGMVSQEGNLGGLYICQGDNFAPPCVYQIVTLGKCYNFVGAWNGTFGSLGPDDMPFMCEQFMESGAEGAVQGVSYPGHGDLIANGFPARSVYCMGVKFGKCGADNCD